MELPALRHVARQGEAMRSSNAGEWGGLARVLYLYVYLYVLYPRVLASR